MATTFVVPGDDSDSDTGDVDIIGTSTSTSLAPGDPNAMDIEEENPQ